MTTPLSQSPISTRYETLGSLGRGDTCEVSISRMVGEGGFVKLAVVKRLLREHAVEPEAMARFFDEARLTTRLTHANIVTTFEIAHDADGPFIAMELLEGQTLARILASGARLPAPLTLAIVFDLLAALEYAHGLRDYAHQPLGVVHRALAPKNVFVLYSGRAKLGKFAHARARDAIVETRSGPSTAEVRYLAPERTRGVADARSDLFSVGVILWEALTGEPYWGERSDVEVVAELTRGFAPRPLGEYAPGSSDALADVCARATAADPEARFGSARDMLVALEKVVEDEGLACRARDVARWLEGTFAADRHASRAHLEALLAAAAAREAPTIPPPRRAALAQLGAAASEVEETLPAQEMDAAPDPAPARAKWGRSIFIAVAGVLVAAAVVFFFPRSDRRAELGRAAVAASSATALPPAGPPSADPSAPADIVLDLRASPADAEIRFDGALVPNPYHARRPRDGALHTLAVSAGPRFAPVRRNVSLSADARLDVELAPMAAPAAHAGRSGSRSITNPPGRAVDEPTAKPTAAAFDEQKLEAPASKRQPAASLDAEDPWKK